MTDFDRLPQQNDIRGLIKSAFDADLPVAGGWGYTEEDATVITDLPQGMTLPQLEHMLTSIRAHLEMNLTRTEEARYGAINATERKRETLRENNVLFDKVTYEITAMKEKIYNAFIKEYKEGYGKETFDLNAHFQKRKEATLTRKILYYFEVSALQ